MPRRLACVVDGAEKSSLLVARKFQVASQKRARYIGDLPKLISQCFGNPPGLVGAADQVLNVLHHRLLSVGDNCTPITATRPPRGGAGLRYAPRGLQP